MEVGEQQLTGAQHLALDRLRLFHFDDHIRSCKNLFSGFDDGRTSGHIVFIGKTGTKTGTRLNKNVVAVVNGFMGRVWRHSNAKFLGLDFGRASDFHVKSSY